MTSPPGSPRREASQTMAFVKNTNPDVFHIRPRPGGIVPIDEDSFVTSTKIGEDQFAKDLKTKIDEKVSKEFRVQTALDEDDLSLDSEDATAPNPVKDAMYMFGVTISTLVMMASKRSDIPQDYLVWTSQCLECIKDDFGNHPPNVQGILNHIKYLNGQSGGGTRGDDGGAAATTGDETTDEEGEQTIRTTTTVKMPEDE